MIALLGLLDLPVLGRVLRRPTVFPVPAFALRLLFGQMANEALLSSTRAVPKALLDQLAEGGRLVIPVGTADQSLRLIERQPQRYVETKLDAVRFVPCETPPDLGDVVERFYKPLVLRLQNLRVPTIAAVNGIAAGAGASLALACDLVLAAKSASFLQAFSKIGLVPDTGGTWFLPQRVGMARAMGLAMLADKLPAEKAADWGLIWAAYEDAEFAAKVDALAAQLAAMPTKALVRTRQAMHAAPGHTLEQQLSFEGGFMRELGWSPDYAEGVAAFMEKRAPKFTGE